MTSSERSHDAAANQPHDTPEIREKEQALFDRATKPIVYAPEVEDVRQLDRPTSRVFRVALRHATRGNGNGAVTFNPG